MKVLNDIDPWFEQLNDALSYVSVCPCGEGLHIRRQDFEALGRLVEAEALKRRQKRGRSLLDSPDKDNASS